MLKLSRKLLVAAVAMTFLVFGAVILGSVTPVNAQEKYPAASIAIVDVTHILNVSTPWKNAEKEMKGRVADVQLEINSRKDVLKTKADELKRQKTILAPDVYQQKAIEIQKQTRVLQREAQVSNAKVNDVLNQVRGRLRGVIVKLAAAVASEKKLNIGFDRANVIFFGDGMDISDEVLKRFNESKTKIEITVDKKQ